MARNVTFIPARRTITKKIAAGEKITKKIRVAAYCRVSTDADEQLNSFENQVEYYTNYINENPSYELAGIYADEGITGTSTKKRAEFNRMIKDCEDKKIDLVITKSISRFARNTQDCLQYSRHLKKLGIGIIFEKENINTIDTTGELLFTILSSLAQDESRNISENCKWGIRSKFQKGIPHINTHKFMGYNKGKDGRLVIDEKQAALVRRIYRDFLEGFNPSVIAKELNDEKVPGVSGEPKWRKMTIEGMLKNEKYKGDSLLQKTYTADFLTKRQVKNKGEIPQYYVEESHPAIISDEDWNAVQLEFERRERFKEEHHTKKYGYGSELRPFSTKVICSHCGSIYGIKSWKARDVSYWECNKRYKEKGTIGCRGESIQNDAIEKGFIMAWNKVVKTRKNRMKEWNKPGENALITLRRNQMIMLTAEGEIHNYIPELIQMVLEKIVVISEKEMIVYFLDGTQIPVKIILGPVGR